ncbi:MAG TPA: hypothetical protein VF101_14630 [Gaiellaceae bacterium]
MAAVAAAVVCCACVLGAAALWVGAGWPDGIGTAIFDLVTIAWLAVPSALLAGLMYGGHLGRRVFVAGAVTIELAVAGFAYASASDTSSSTGGVGVLVAPIWGVAAALVLWAAHAALGRLAACGTEQTS